MCIIYDIDIIKNINNDINNNNNKYDKIIITVI